MKCSGGEGGGSCVWVGAKPASHMLACRCCAAKPAARPIASSVGARWTLRKRRRLLTGRWAGEGYSLAVSCDEVTESTIEEQRPSIAAVFPLRADRRVLISATISVRSHSSAVSRATSSPILAPICIIVKIGLRQGYLT